MKRFLFTRRTWLFLAIFTNLAFLAMFASPGSSYVLKSYTLSQAKPLSFKFNIDGGQPINFAYNANTTLDMVVYIVGQNNTQVALSILTGNSSTIEYSRSTSWTCNITLSLPIGYTGIGASVDVRYTYIKTIGIELAIAIVIVAAAMVVFFIWLLVSKRKVTEPPINESKQTGEETNG